MAEERNFRTVRRGYVVSDKMDKTISVELEQRSTHPLYGKVVRSTRTVKENDTARSNVLPIFRTGITRTWPKNLFRSCPTNVFTVILSLSTTSSVEAFLVNGSHCTDPISTEIRDFPGNTKLSENTGILRASSP